MRTANLCLIALVVGSLLLVGSPLVEAARVGEYTVPEGEELTFVVNGEAPFSLEQHLGRARIVHLDPRGLDTYLIRIECFDAPQPANVCLGFILDNSGGTLVGGYTLAEDESMDFIVNGVPPFSLVGFLGTANFDGDQEHISLNTWRLPIKCLMGGGSTATCVGGITDSS